LSQRPGGVRREMKQSVKNERGDMGRRGREWVECEENCEVGWGREEGRYGWDWRLRKGM